MKSTLLIISLLLSQIIFTQKVKGTVTDNDGNTLPFVSIIDSISKVSEKTNQNGGYTFILEQDTTSIWFHAEGYESKFHEALKTQASNTLNITLQKSVKEIEQVTIIPISEKDKGKEIMKKVIGKRSYYQELLNEYRCNTYCITSLESNVFDSIQKDSIIRKKSEGIYEWNAYTSFKKGKYKDEFFAINDYGYDQRFKTYSGNTNISIGTNSSGFGEKSESLVTQYEINTNPYLFINGIENAHFSILDNTINAKKITENPLISPLAYNAFLFYNFYYKTSYIDSNARLIHEIEVKPISKFEALFIGKLFIQDSTWAVKSYKLSVNPKVLKYFKKIEISCEYEEIDSVLIPTYREFNYLIKDGEKYIAGNARINHKEYEFKVQDEAKKYWLEIATYTDDAYDKDSIFWNKSRGFKLKEFEKNYIFQQDSIVNHHESKEYLQHVDSMRNEFNWKNLAFNGWGHVNSFKKYEFQIRPLIGVLQPLGVGGFRYLFDISYQKEFKNGKIIYVKPFVDYGNYNKDLKGSFDGSIMYNRLNFSKIGFKIGDNYDRIANTQNVINSFVPTNLVSNKRFEINFSREITNGLYMNLELLYSDRNSVENIDYPAWYDSLPEFLVQNPVPFDSYKIMLLTTKFEYKFRQKYTIRKGKKIVYGSPWPSLFLTYKKAVPSIFGTEANFDLIEITLKDDIELNSFGTTNIKLQAGQFLQKKDLRLFENKYFRQSDNFFFSNPINTMQMMDTSLNTALSYLQFNYIHHFNGFFLNKIWGINRLKLKEIFGGGIISIPSANFLQNEFYLGIERQFRIRKTIFKLGVYSVTNQNNMTGPSSQIKFGINFYDVFSDKWDY